MYITNMYNTNNVDFDREKQADGFNDNSIINNNTDDNDNNTIINNFSEVIK